MTHNGPAIKTTEPKVAIYNVGIVRGQLSDHAPTESKILTAASGASGASTWLSRDLGKQLTIIVRVISRYILYHTRCQTIDIVDI